MGLHSCQRNNITKLLSDITQRKRNYKLCERNVMLQAVLISYFSRRLHPSLPLATSFPEDQFHSLMLSVHDTVRLSLALCLTEIIE
jgi:hypothetical protein